MEQSSYEDDLQILRVIESYCFSKQRQTITNSGERIYAVLAHNKRTRLLTMLTLNFPTIFLFFLAGVFIVYSQDNVSVDTGAQ